jgi:hypothetical protein
MARIIRTHITVNAPVEAVWKTLTDLACYQQWNPFITAAAGTVSVGERLHLRIQSPGAQAMTFKPWVTAVEPHRYLEWLGRTALPGIFDGRHSFRLTPLAGGRSLMQQSETFTGLLIPFAGPLLRRTQDGFIAMNDALATRCTESSKHGLDVLRRRPGAGAEAAQARPT